MICVSLKIRELRILTCDFHYMGFIKSLGLVKDDAQN